MADITLTDIEKWFGDNYVIRKLNLEVKDREFLVLLGASGCGKTTTLRAIAGLEEIDSGEIRIDGKTVHHLRASDRDIAFVFQLYALYPHMSVFDNIAFPLKAIKESKETIQNRVRQVAAVLQIENTLDKMPSSLSSGDMQRVAVGRALVRRPRAILMDEPIGSLDAKLREEMRTELKRLHLKTGATTLYVTHDQVEAMAMADRIAIMKDGILQQVGTPAQVYDHPANLFVAQFIGSPIINVLECSVGFDGNQTVVSLGNNGIRLGFPGSLYQSLENHGHLSGGLVLGVRPEAVRVEKANTQGFVETDVHVIEPLGPYDIVDIRVGDDLIRAKTTTRFMARAGEKVWFHLDEARTHFFDKKSGKIIDI